MERASLGEDEEAAGSVGGGACMCEVERRWRNFVCEEISGENEFRERREIGAGEVSEWMSSYL